MTSFLVDSSSPGPLPGPTLGLTRDDVVSALLDVPLRIVVILTVSLLVVVILRRVIRGLTNRLATGATRRGRLASSEIGIALRNASPLNDARRAQRARTVGSVLLSLSNIVVATIAVLLVLDVLDVSIAPFLASAGIVGVALGFGAQTLVKDFLSGLFMLMEDQYGVGDTIEVGTVSGTVEAVALRITEVRDGDGTLWFIRNGEILKVGNKTQGWARASVDVQLPYSTDLAAAHAALQTAVDAVMADEDVSTTIQEEPVVGGVESMTATSLTVRITARTDPAAQWDVARALRVAVRDALEKARIPMAQANQQVLVVRDGGGAHPDSFGDSRTPGA